MATKVRIKIRAFPYYVDREDPVTGRPVRQEIVAVRGQEADLNDVDLERAKRFEAIYVDSEGNPVVDEVPEEQATPGVTADSFDLETADVETTASWLKGELTDQDGKPTVDEVIGEINEDPVTAKKVIEAENLATGQDPRSTLVERAEAIAEANS